MADVEAGQSNAQTQQQPVSEAPPEQPRQYTQEEVDRITAKVRKNAARDTEIKLRRELGSQPRQEERQEPEAPKPPKREDFESYEDYLVEKARFEARSVSREEREKAEKEAREKTVREQREKTQREFKSRAEATMKEIVDFQEVIESAEDVMITGVMGEAIAESPIGPRILYELAKNPAEAQRIAQLPAASQIREIGKLEARLESAKKPDTKDEGEEPGKEPDKGSERNQDGTFKSKEPSKAPDPITPTGGRSASGDATVPSDKDDPETWLKKRNAQLAKRRGK